MHERQEQNTFHGSSPQPNGDGKENVSQQDDFQEKNKTLIAENAELKRQLAAQKAHIDGLLGIVELFVAKNKEHLRQTAVPRQPVSDFWKDEPRLFISETNTAPNSHKRKAQTEPSLRPKVEHSRDAHIIRNAIQENTQDEKAPTTSRMSIRQKR